jgi:nitrogenase-stabilizing/protective protein
MTWNLTEFNRLVDTEEYFDFFQLPYDPKVVSVNRLHILQRFSQAINEIDARLADASPEDRLSEYRLALQQAYEVFLSSTPLEQKLFKVFNQKPQNIVLLTDINES